MQESPYYIVGNVTRVHSPVTLSNEWPTLGRLVFMVICSCLGTIINGFFVSSFFVERTLKRLGNVFLACVGLSDLILTTIVMPISSVVLLSGEWDVLAVCLALQFLAISSTYGYSLFFTLVSAETYYRICRSTDDYAAFLSMGVGLVSILIFTISFLAAALGVYLEFDYDYCRRKHFGNYYFRYTTSVIFHAVPFLLTMTGLIAASVCVRRRARKQLHYRRSQQYEKDYSTTNLNIIAYVFYVVAWIPYLIIVHEFPNTSDSKYYYSVWFGIFRSVFSSLLYCSLNRNFRRAFSHLFYYCCCKSSLSDSYNSRHTRTYQYKTATGDVRVHIMHQAVSISSPQRASSSRETQDL